MFLDTGVKTECFGCESCVLSCGKQAISMQEDAEGFRYPVVDLNLCINCGLCRIACPAVHMPEKYEDNKYVFGGYHLDPSTRFESTSGGAFSAIVDTFCDENYVIFGAEANGLLVSHSYITDKKDLWKYRKSKYSQSVIGTAYKQARLFLKNGKKVVFSGTPCQIAGLRTFLSGTDQDKLLTIEVVCEGVPSPLYIRKMESFMIKKYGASVESLDYRYKGRSLLSDGKRDFEIMRVKLSGMKRALKRDRWFNPFWSIWLNHLMSRPSCYVCRFATAGRTADITLGDLWGVHLYCPELYGKNGGASLVVCNTAKGRLVFQKAQEKMFGHELSFADALKYQGPMRKTISMNPDRESFMKDLRSDMDIRAINNKWAKRPTVKTLINKYLWGNRQSVALWKLKQRVTIKKGR